MTPRCEILCHGPIGGWSGLQAQDVIQQLRAAPAGAEVVVRINSEGGDALEGISICNALRSHTGRKVVTVDGLAGSAASMILCAGDEVVFPENALLMLHNVWSVQIGDADAMRDQAAALDAITAAYVATYQRKTGKTEAEIRELMARSNWDTGTWLTATEAKAAGFCDRIGPPVQLASASLPSAVRERLGRTPQAAALVATLPRPAAPPPSPTREVQMDDLQQLVSELTGKTGAEAQAALRATFAAANSTAPLLAQVKALTGETDPAKQQAALAALPGKITAAEETARAALIGQARARNVPPTAMLGWEHLPLAALADVVGKAAPAATFAPVAVGAPGQVASDNPANPAAAQAQLSAYEQQLIRATPGMSVEKYLAQKTAVMAGANLGAGRVG